MAVDVLKVLFVGINPLHTERLELPSEIKTIEDALDQSEARGHVEIVSKWEITGTDVLWHLSKLKPKIFHFSGHGDIQGLLFLRRNAQAHPIDPAAFARAFDDLPELECVVLNACSSAEQAQLIAEHVPVAIGMGDEINDEAAIEFARGFYRTLGDGVDVATAFEFGKKSYAFIDPNADVCKLYTRAGVDPSTVRLVVSASSGPNASRRDELDEIKRDLEEFSARFKDCKIAHLMAQRIQQESRQLRRPHTLEDISVKLENIQGWHASIEKVNEEHAFGVKTSTLGKYIRIYAAKIDQQRPGLDDDEIVPDRAIVDIDNVYTHAANLAEALDILMLQMLRVVKPLNLLDRLERNLNPQVFSQINTIAQTLKDKHVELDREMSLHHSMQTFEAMVHDCLPVGDDDKISAKTLREILAAARDLQREIVADKISKKVEGQIDALDALASEAGDQRRINKVIHKLLEAMLLAFIELDKSMKTNCEQQVIYVDSIIKMLDSDTEGPR